jgi:pimeloyl-ACP methyl ester carboxylesterase
MTVRVRRDVLADRAAFRLVTSRVGAPDPVVVARVREEVAEALQLFGERGWIDAPQSYHRAPPALTGLRTRDRRSGNLRYTALTWPDGYSPRPEEPGAARFTGYTENRIARAALMEHRSGDRPWLVCLHGWGMGSPGLDLRSFRALHLHRDLGLNLAFATLPFHGRRRPAGSGYLARVPGVDVLDNVHGLAQAAWDVRQLLLHLRERTDQPIGLMGLSLGGYVAALTASLEDGIHAVLLLVPAVDLATLMVEGAERLGGPDAPASAELAQTAVRIFTPVAPLALAPRVPLERRFIAAATLDQFARPTTQAVALWRHWDEPELHWFHGGHVGLFWARGLQSAIDGALVRYQMTGGPTPIA